MSEVVSVEAAVRAFPTPLRPIAQALRELVKASAPEADERWVSGWHAIVYRRGKDFAYLKPDTAYVRLGFYPAVNAATLPDPHGLLEGSGKTMRHVKVGTLDGAPLDALRALVREAYGRVAGPTAKDRSRA